MKKIVKWAVFITGALLLIATASLLWFDYKETSWYYGTVSAAKKLPISPTTVVCVLATVHQANPNYNADSIVDILRLFQPDLILTEEDTLLFQSFHKSYTQTLRQPLLARLKRSFGFGSPEEIEGRAVRKYKIGNPTVDIRPYDYEGRNAFYERNNTFVKENEVSNKLEQLASNHSMTAEQAWIWNIYGRINDNLNKASVQSPYSINQPAYYDLSERRQYYQYHKVAAIISDNDSLKDYREFYRSNADFWDVRNKKMAEHIAKFILLYPNKRIMVLTGSMHKYYLLHELTPLQGELIFRLSEYYD